MNTTTDVELKTLLTQLVQMPTITGDQATCNAALDWVKLQLAGLPLHVSDITYKGYNASVLTTRRTKRPKVLLMAHLDVAPAPAKAFSLREHSGRYYGRGVFDMKFAVAAYIKVLRGLGAQLKHYDLGLMLNTEEEIAGGENGAAQLAKAGWGGRAIINPDAIADWRIQSACKGILRYRITSHGQAGHGSRPWEFRNAVNLLMDYLNDLSARFTAEPCGDDQHAHNTLNVGVFQGGYIANQVPASATADIDIRVMPGHTPADLEAVIHEVASSHPYITTQWLAEGNPVELDTGLAPVQLARTIIRDVTGTDPVFRLSHGSSEAPYFAELGMPVIMFGPPAHGHHGDNEWIDAKGVDQFAEIVRRFIEHEARVS